MRFVGKRDDRDFTNDVRVTLPWYTLLDLSGEWALSSLAPSLTPVTMTARIENALDKLYQPAFGFSAPGRTGAGWREGGAWGEVTGSGKREAGAGAGSGKRETGSGKRETGDGRRETGDGRACHPEPTGEGSRSSR